MLIENKYMKVEKMMIIINNSCENQFINWLKKYCSKYILNVLK